MTWLLAIEFAVAMGVLSIIVVSAAAVVLAAIDHAEREGK